MVILMSKHNGNESKFKIIYISSHVEFFFSFFMQQSLLIGGIYNHVGLHLVAINALTHDALKSIYSVYTVYYMNV